MSAAVVAGQDQASAVFARVAFVSIQHQSFRVTNERNVNVGIFYPVLLPGATNVFRVTANFVSDTDQLVGDARAALLVTHFVINDKVVLEW